MSKKTKETISHAGFFTAFFFLQLTVLGLGNRMGEGWLPTTRREMVYYIIQVFVITGFLSYAAVWEFVRGKRAVRRITSAALAVLFAGAVILLLGVSSYAGMVPAFASMLCLGYTGGAVYHRMSLYAASGEKIALSTCSGCAAAITLQYFLQFHWGVTPLLAPAMAVSFALIAAVLIKQRDGEPSGASVLSKNGTEVISEHVHKKAWSKLFAACVISAAILLMISFYNEYIHHMQIRTSYTDYNVYSWPRLAMVPCYIFFGIIGDIKQGKYVPLSALCIVLAALLNSVLTGSTDAYWLNMCLFYTALAGVVSYYILTFLRLAPLTKHPALWASTGRVMDSAVVLTTGFVHISALPSALVLAVDIVLIVLIILIMAANGDLAFSAATPAEPELAPVYVSEHDSTPVPDVSEINVFDAIRSRYSLTQRETDVLRELVLTEDKQAVIGERLSIKVNTLQGYVTRIYRKTGAATRSGLNEIYHKTLSELTG